MHRRLLIADASETDRAALCQMLGGVYEVLEAADGREALELLRRESATISAVLLDVLLPAMSGFEVLEAIGREPELAAIPVIATSENADGGTEERALALGAQDCIAKPYNAAVIRHRVANTIRLRETAAIANTARRDDLTGLYTRSAFFERAAELIAEHEAGYWVISCFDIDSFKVVNDQYGTETGDEVLRYIAQVVGGCVGEIGGIMCRVIADTFAMLYPRVYMDSEKLRANHRAATMPGCIRQPLNIRIGRYVVNDLSLTCSAMYDRAVLAQESVKGRYDVRVGMYNETMREQLLRERRIVTEMNGALRDGEFEPWFQPQYNHETGALVGAEALVRWRRDGALVPPSEFVPVFERNGFIYEMDKYIWERVCALLRSWIDAGREPLPVSVNISRHDLMVPGFHETITGLAAKYAVPVGLLRLEVTESAFAGGAEQIVERVRRLVDAGFTVEIDDFGSGYSSLNTLKDVPATILKLDMRFLERSGDTRRGGNIVESVVRMAKWLGMAVIAEGVETREQADYLLTIGCRYVQGYLYAKPMPLADYEALTEAGGGERELRALETVETLDNNAFWDPASMETLIFNSYVGGACIFEYRNGRAELLRANASYARELGLDADAPLQKLELDSLLAEGESAALHAMIRRAEELGREASCEVRLDTDGAARYIRATVRMLARADERCLFYCVVINMTPQREAERLARESAEQLTAIMSSVNAGVSASVFDPDGTARLIFANDLFYAMLDYTKEQFEREKNDVWKLIHPDDTERLHGVIASLLLDRAPAAFEYRCVCRDGRVMDARCNASMTGIAGVGESVLIAVVTDVTELKRVERTAAENAERLRMIMTGVNGGVTVSALLSGVPRILYSNEQFYTQLGYTREQYEREVRNPNDCIHPDDRARVSEQMRAANERREPFTAVYRVVRRDGGVRWLRVNVSITSFPDLDEPVQLTVASDVTAERAALEELRDADEQLRFLNNTAHDLLAEAGADESIERVLGKLLGYFGGKRAYLFEFDFERCSSKNTYEVCAEGVESEKANLQSVPLEVIGFWMHAFDKRSYISIADVNALGEDRAAEREMLAAEGVVSLVAVPLYRDGALIGFIGIDDPGRRRLLVERLVALGDYLAVMLTRRDLTAKIERDNRTLIGLMDGTPGGFMRMQMLPDGTIVPLYINNGFCRLVGMTHEECMALYETDATASIHPDDVGIVREAVADMFRTGEARSFRCRLGSRDGGCVRVKLYGCMTKNDAGEVFLNLYYTDLSAQEGAAQPYRGALLPATIASASDLSFAKDTSLRYTYVSPKFARLAGFADVCDLVGRTDAELFGAEAAARNGAIERPLLEGAEASREGVEPIAAADGTTRYADVMRCPLRDGDGEIVGIYGSGHDVTEYRTAFERLRLVTDSIPGGIASYEVSHGGMKLLYCSDGFSRISGYTKEEYLQIAESDPLELAFPEDLPNILEVFERVLSGADDFRYEYRSRHRDGKTRWVSIQGAVVERRGASFLANVVKLDVTDRRAAEERLRVSEEQYRLAQEQSGSIMCTYEIATRRLFFTESAAALLGVGTVLEDVPYEPVKRGRIAPESREDYIGFYERILAGEKTGTAELRIVTPAGWRWFHAVFSAVRGGDGAPVSAVLSFSDTTGERERRDEKERLFRVVAAHSNRRIFRYDIATGAVRTVGEDGDELTGVIGADAPETFDGWRVLPDSLEDYRGLFTEIREHGRDGTARLHMRAPDGGVRWLELRYSLLGGEERKPKAAVLSALDITGEYERELAYRRYQETMREEMSRERVIFFDTNLTADVVEKVGGSLPCYESPPIGERHDETVAIGVNGLLAEPLREKGRVYFSREHLIAAFRDGVRRLGEEWPNETQEGERRWYRSVIRMMQDPYSGHIRAYTSLEDITEEKREALDTRRQAETDGATGLYNKATAESRVRGLLSRTEGTPCALLIADLDDLKCVNDTYGHPIGDAAIRRMAEGLSARFRRTDVIGRIGGDEFLVFLEGMNDRDRLRTMTDGLLAWLGGMSVGGQPLGASIGVALGETGRDGFEDLYARADRALYIAKRDGKRRVAFWEEG